MPLSKIEEIIACSVRTKILLNTLFNCSIFLFCCQTICNDREQALIDKKNYGNVMHEMYTLWQGTKSINHVRFTFAIQIKMQLKHFNNKVCNSNKFSNS